MQEDIWKYPPSAIYNMTLYAEGRSEGIEGLILIGMTILNRAYSPIRWPDTIKRVCLQPKQFSCWNDLTDPNTVKTLAAWENKHYDANMKQCLWVTDGIINGHICKSDLYTSINHYHHKRILPYWVTGREPLIKHKNHWFYAL
jgi:spore germination cell wall hydrolase CwlJ-like protein